MTAYEMVEHEVYRDEDPLGEGKFFGYTTRGAGTRNGHSFGNVGPFDTAEECLEAAKAKWAEMAA